MTIQAKNRTPKSITTSAIKCYKRCVGWSDQVQGGERKRSGATLIDDNIADDAPSGQIYELFNCRSNNDNQMSGIFSPIRANPEERKALKFMAKS